MYFPYFALLIPAWIAANSFSSGLSIFDFDSLWSCLLSLYIFFFALAVAAQAFLRSASESLLVSACIFVAIFSKGAIEASLKTLDNWVGIAPWQPLIAFFYLGAIVALPLAGLSLGRRYPALWPCANWITALAFLVPVYGILAATIPEGNETLPTAEEQIVGLPKDSYKPNILHIVVDAYPSSRPLKLYHHFDNEPFEDELKSLGFQVFPEASATYASTLLSMASTLQMDFLPAVEHEDSNASHTTGPSVVWHGSSVELDSSENYVDSLKAAVKENRVKRSLENIGYEWVTIRSDYPDMEVTDNSTRPCNAGGWGMFEHYLYRNTFIPEALRRIMQHIPFPLMDVALVDCVESDVHFLNQMESNQKPFIAYHHIMAPHFPFDISDEGGYQWPETPDWGQLKGNNPENEQARFSKLFVNKIKHTNNYLLRYLHKLQQSAKEDLVIIVQGDHGGRILTGKGRAGTCMDDQLPALLAISLPNSLKVQSQNLIPPGASGLVNLYRNLFRTIYRADIPPLDNKYVYTDWFNFQCHHELAGPNVMDFCPSQPIR